MSYLIAFGILFIGLMTGIILAYYIERSETMTTKLLGSSMSILMGAGLLMAFSQGHLLDEHWFFPVGICGGFILGTSLELVGGPYHLFPLQPNAGTSSNQRASENLTRK